MGSLISILVMSSSIQFTALTVLSAMYVLCVPYTKVEESFNIQATHDFLFIGFPRTYHLLYEWCESMFNWLNSIEVVHSINLNHLPVPEPTYNMTFERWDHQDFTGPVYRTFLGSFFVSLATLPFKLISQSAYVMDKYYLQIISRINLSIFVVTAFNSFANAVGRKYGSTTRRSLVVLTFTQFHFIYYDSRTLPNTYAMGVCLFAFSKWIDRKFDAMVALIAVVVVIFRFETILLFGIILAYEVFVQKSLAIKRILLVGIPSGLVSIAATVLFDSWMWGTKTWIWPELHSIYFNLYLNKSSDWGSSPFLWYFYSAIPRALLFSIIFLPFASRRALKNFLALPLLFVLVYSFLPHKELRFIIYVVPLLNTCAANTVGIMVEKFEGNKPSPESALLCYIARYFKWSNAITVEQEGAADREREEREKEEEEIKERVRQLKLQSKLPPQQYDAIDTPTTSCFGPSSGLRNRKSNQAKLRNGVESILDEQYSKITAAVLEKHRTVDAILKSKNAKNPDGEPDGEQNEVATLTCSFILIFIILGIHIWCNVGCTIYASLASWNNYPGGDAITIVNQQIKTTDSLVYQNNEMAVYVTNLAAQTGVTRFYQLDHIVYDKSPTLDHVANRTIFMRRGKGFNKNITHDFSGFKLIYLILEKIDVPFLQIYCTSQMKKNKSASSGIENVICNFGENTKNCKIMKVVSGFNGIDLGLSSKNLVIKTTPMLWIFRCVK